MPRMLPRHKYADYMVVSAGYAEQDLASSHNMITIRPRAVDMADAPSSRSAFTAGTITL